jgi:hypothetical protein
MTARLQLSTNHRRLAVPRPAAHLLSQVALLLQYLATAREATAIKELAAILQRQEWTRRHSLEACLLEECRS